MIVMPVRRKRNYYKLYLSLGAILILSVPFFLQFYSSLRIRLRLEEALRSANEVEIGFRVPTKQNPQLYERYGIPFYFDEKSDSELIRLLHADRYGSYQKGGRPNCYFYIPMYGGHPRMDAEAAFFRYNSDTGQIWANKELTYGCIVPEPFRVAISEKLHQLQIEQQEKMQRFQKILQSATAVEVGFLNRTGANPQKFKRSGVPFKLNEKSDPELIRMLHTDQYSTDLKGGVRGCYYIDVLSPGGQLQTKKERPMYLFDP